MIYKESYQRTQLIITEFDKEDVIITSAEPQTPIETGDNGLPIFGPGFGSSNGSLSSPGGRSWY